MIALLQTSPKAFLESAG